MRCEAKQVDRYGLASVGLGAGLCLTGIYMLQCLTYLHRSVVGASLLEEI